MATKIITKNSSTATSIRTAGDLVQGELAVNVTDKRLFTEDSGGAIVELGTNPSTLTSGAATFSGNVGLPLGGIIDFSSRGNITHDASTYDIAFNTNSVANAFVVKGTGAATFSGNVGIGVSPSAWGAGYNVIDLNTGAAIYGSTTGVSTASNLYFSGSNWIAKTTGAGTLYAQHSGAHFWYNSPSVTAGSTAGLSERMTLDASGNVGIGTNSPSFNLTAKGAANQAFLSTEDSTGVYRGIYGTDSAVGAGALFGSLSNHPAIIRTNNTERMRIDASGNLGIGTSSPSTYAKFAIRGGLTTNAGSTSLTGASFSTSDNANSTFWITHASGTTNLITDVPMAFYTASGSGVAERMRIDASGNLLVGTASNANLARIKLAWTSGNYGIESKASADTLSYHAVFGNATYNAAGFITTTNNTAAYSTTSDPRLKSEFVAPLNALDKIVEARDNQLIGEFEFLSQPEEKVWGYNAHKLIDMQSGFGGVEGQGPRDLAIGEEYEPAVLDEDGNVITPAKTVSPAGVDQSKRVPLLEAAIYELLQMNQAQQAIIEVLTARIEALEGA